MEGDQDLENSIIEKRIYDRLTELARQKGQLNNQDILDAVAEIDVSPEDIETIYEQLREDGVTIVEEQIEDIRLGDQVLVPAQSLTNLYQNEFKLLLPALRLSRIKTVLEGRLSQWEKQLVTQYENQYKNRYRGKDLEFAVRMAVSQRLQPVRAAIRKNTEFRPESLYRAALSDAPAEGTSSAAILLRTLPGDTVWSLGKRKKLPCSAIRSVNGLGEDEEPTPGTLLLLAK